MTFGAVAGDFADATFTLNYNINGGVGGIVVNSTSANVTIGGTANLAFTQNGSLSVATGSTLNITNVFNAISGINWNQKTMTLSGGGTINFNTSVVANGGTANQNDANLTVNFRKAFFNSATQTYTLTAGKLNFETAASANALRKNFNINGGIIDNTSGSAMTVAVPSTFGIGGDFTFAGSSALAINKAVALAATRRITVTQNNLTLGGIISVSGAGLTKAGNGTLTFSGAGANTYDGATNVNEGALVIDGTSTLTIGSVTVAPAAGLGGNGTTPAAVTLQADGKLLVGISDWSGPAGTGFTDLEVGDLVIDGALTVDVTSLAAYTNFTEANATFPILTVTTPGGITGFNTANVTVTADAFPGTGTWDVVQNGNSLELVYTAGSGDDYVTWDNQYAADLSDKNADNDGDGLSNFQEYAFGLDPTSSASVNPITDLSTLKSAGTFSYTRRAGTGLTYSVWSSTDLQDWGTEPVVTDQEAGAVVDGVETVLVTLPSIPTDAKLFLRVQAE